VPFILFYGYSKTHATEFNEILCLFQRTFCFKIYLLIIVFIVVFHTLTYEGDLKSKVS